MVARAEEGSTESIVYSDLAVWPPWKIVDPSPLVRVMLELLKVTLRANGPSHRELTEIRRMVAART